MDYQLTEEQQAIQDMAQRFTAVYREVTDPHELSPADDLASTLPTREPSAIN